VSGIDDPSEKFSDESLDTAGAQLIGPVGGGVLGRAMPESDAADQAFISAAEAQTAAARAAAIAAGRRKGGVAGAALAGAMFAVADIYEGPRKEKSSVVVEASSDPNDLDADGLEVTVGEVSVAAPALERLEPVSERDRRKRPVV
jgi:hypothetical protein